MTGVAKKDEIEAPAPDESVEDRMLVQLTVKQLRTLLRDEVDSAVSRALEAKPVVKSTRWVDVGDAADHFRVTPQTIRNWCREGAPHRTFGTGKSSVYRIDLAVFEAWVDTASRSRGSNG